MPPAEIQAILTKYLHLTPFSELYQAFIDDYGAMGERQVQRHLRVLRARSAKLTNKP